MGKVYIYGLKDPRDNAIHYVGKSTRPKRRLEQHLADISTNKDRVDWLRDLQAAGSEPELTILEKSNDEDWQEAECKWIAIGREEGWPLTNISRGGSGGIRGQAKPKQMSSKWECLRHYTTDAIWDKFKKLDDQYKLSICRLTALAMMQNCWVAIKARGGDPREEFDDDKDFAIACIMACNLIMAAEDEARFNEQAAKIDKASSQMIAQVNAFISLYD